MLQEKLAAAVYSGAGANSEATDALGRFSGVRQRNTLSKCLLSMLAGSRELGYAAATSLTASPYPSSPAH